MGLCVMRCAKRACYGAVYVRRLFSHVDKHCNHAHILSDITQTEAKSAGRGGLVTVKRHDVFKTSGVHDWTRLPWCVLHQIAVAQA